MTIHTAVHDGQSVVTLVGELDMTTAPILAGCARELLDAGPPRLVLDLSGLDFCDSSGMGQFVIACNDCTTAGGWLRLAAPQPQLARVLGIAGLLSLLPTYRSLDGALTADDEDRLT
jgi:anti-sigma B factor antagonist